MISSMWDFVEWGTQNPGRAIKVLEAAIEHAHHFIDEKKLKAWIEAS